jgi:hypothetical protein
MAAPKVTKKQLAAGAYGTPVVKENKKFGTWTSSSPVSGTLRLQERVFFDELQRVGLPLPVWEFYFHPTRMWRFDYCWVEQKIALEVEGGVTTFGMSRHQQNDGYQNDMEKYNAATVMGYRVLRYTWGQLIRPQTIADLVAVFGLKIVEL